MLAQQSSSASTPRRGRQIGARSGLALIAGALAVGLIACGGGSSTPAASSTSTPSSGSRAAAPSAPPGTFGTAAAVNATSVEVQNPSTGQVTVNFSSATTFDNTVSGALANVIVGSCVTVTSAAAAGSAAPAAGSPLTARSVTITVAGASGCAAGGAGGFGGGGRGGAGGTRPSGSVRPSGSTRPSGANGAGGGNFGRAAFGSVTAVSATGFTVHSVARGTNPATDTPVTVTSSTTYSAVQSATSSALAVGDCIAAVGATDDTGAVTAKTISISKPGPNGCSTGFGGGRGANGGGANGGGASGGSNG